MVVTPIPGAHRDNVWKTLRSLHLAAENLEGKNFSSAYPRLLAYLEWANEAVRMLTSQITSRDIDNLIRTRMHQSLLDGVGHLAGSEQGRLVNGLVSLELRQRVNAFSEAVEAFQAQMRRWPEFVVVAVLDTSFFIEHEVKLEEADFSKLLGVEGRLPVAVVVPMAVVDELDKLKESRNQHTRWRAGYSLAVLDRLLTEKVSLGPSKVEVLTDTPGHVRLPEADDEIVDRALAVYAMAAGEVQLVTYDTGMAMRAKMLNLPVLKLRNDAGTGIEPDRK
ncbi:PIN domain-containing protein [Streptomyces sp. NBC_01207]|uniref:PIN domain-containing protein n=1 Tax=Streptomyces sp. NBC_01207 TaxID=2903772 RepID=UPI002E103086|nr:PIN domain-containing protein [Streptomyces sp. NBC_01207]